MSENPGDADGPADTDEESDPDEREQPSLPSLPEPIDDEREDGPVDPAADLPADVRSSLTQLLEEARVALREGRTADALAAVDSAESVAANKLPSGALRGQLRHGCARVTDLAEADPTTAIEYLAAMRRRLP